MLYINAPLTVNLVNMDDNVYLHVLICKYAVHCMAYLWNVASDSFLTMAKLQMYAFHGLACSQKSQCCR